MGVRSQYLVLEDHAPLARCLRDVLSSFGETTIATSIADAERELARETFTAWVIDVLLPDGSGLDFLARARIAHPTTPALVLTACHEPSAINRAFDLNADYVVKPVERRRIERFLELHAPLDVRIRVGVSRWACQYELSSVEAEILRRAVEGESRDTIAAARDCSVLTVKKHVGSILQKTSHASLHSAIQAVLREVSGSEA
jgi:DNA-binding NarL/FixJ family response regulator